MQQAWIYVLSAMLAVASYTDLRHRRIPNWLTCWGAGAGILASVLDKGLLHGGIRSLAGLTAGLLPMLLLYLWGAVGAGDVKLFGAVGAIGGAAFVYLSTVYSILCAGLIALAVLAVKGLLRKRSSELGALLLRFMVLYDSEAVIGMSRSKEWIRFPFMLAAAPGMLFTLWYVWM